MTWVLAPEPAPWLAQLDLLLPPGARAHVLAPWALPRVPWLPARVRAAWARRVLAAPEGTRVWGVPGWQAVETALRLAAPSAAATFRARFALRRRVAQALSLLPTAPDGVVAPSLAARELFAHVRARGGRCVLVEDLPSLRELHADLDAAAAAHPEEAFLRNHRARAADVARQEAERVLADAIWVRSPLARERLLQAGHVPERVHLLPAPPVASARRFAPPTGRTALLAGPALARAGLREALAALDALPGWTLRVRPVDATPADVLRHPRVQVADPRDVLADVAVVLAPAWCECHPPELARAASYGLPVVATDRAAGGLPVRRVPRGDASALVRELLALEPTLTGAPLPTSARSRSDAPARVRR